MKWIQWILLLAVVGCCAELIRCTPAEQREAYAVKAFAVDLVTFCQPDDTVRDCINKLIMLGIRQIDLHPEMLDGGNE